MYACSTCCHAGHHICRSVHITCVHSAACMGVLVSHACVHTGIPLHRQFTYAHTLYQILYRRWVQRTAHGGKRAPCVTPSSPAPGEATPPKSYGLCSVPATFPAHTQPSSVWGQGRTWRDRTRPEAVCWLRTRGNRPAASLELGPSHSEAPKLPGIISGYRCGGVTCS